MSAQKDSVSKDSLYWKTPKKVLEEDEEMRFARKLACVKGKPGWMSWNQWVQEMLEDDPRVS